MYERKLKLHANVLKGMFGCAKRIGFGEDGLGFRENLSNLVDVGVQVLFLFFGGFFLNKV